MHMVQPTLPAHLVDNEKNAKVHLIVGPREFNVYFSSLLVLACIKNTSVPWLCPR